MGWHRRRSCTCCPGFRRMPTSAGDGSCGCIFFTGAEGVGLAFLLDIFPARLILAGANNAIVQFTRSGYDKKNVLVGATRSSRTRCFVPTWYSKPSQDFVAVHRSETAVVFASRAQRNQFALSLAVCHQVRYARLRRTASFSSRSCQRQLCHAIESSAPEEMTFQCAFSVST